MASLLLVDFMNVYFNNVITDNRALNENPMFKMVNEAYWFHGIYVRKCFWS